MIRIIIEYNVIIKKVHNLQRGPYHLTNQRNKSQAQSSKTQPDVDLYVSSPRERLDRRCTRQSGHRRESLRSADRTQSVHTDGRKNPF